jgi:hypothetical protein
MACRRHALALIRLVLVIIICMRKWYILITVLIIGFAVAMLAFFLVAKAPSPDVKSDTTARGFVSFFGRGFGFIDDVPEGSVPTGSSTPEIRPTFRQRLALEGMIPVSPELISGITFTASTTATTTIEWVRYVLRETGRIEDLSLDTGDTKRVTNTTVPRIQEAFFGENGSAVALRYLGADNETVETYIAPLPTDPFASSTELVGTFFRQNIPSLAFSPTTNQVFYLTESNTGATGRIANLSNTASRVVFSSPLSEWLASWEAPGSVLVTSKPSYIAAGNAVRVRENGEETLLLDGIRGLTTLPNPSMTRVLYSQSNGGTTRLFVYDISSRQTRELPTPTLPEKCVWVDDLHVICAIPTIISGAMPDAWYQGNASFTDSFWMLNTESGEVDFLFDPSETSAREDVDAIELHLSYDNTVLSFINKKDLRGWVADLSEWF